MIAVDTNILVYAHRRDSRWHEPAARAVRELAEGRRAWMIPWPSVHEFVAVVTHPRIYKPASTLQQALAQLELWMASPTLMLGGESGGYWERFKAVASRAQVAGADVHDARIVAICIEHGVDALLTADRDLSRFADLRVRNPLIG